MQAERISVLPGSCTYGSHAIVWSAKACLVVGCASSRRVRKATVVSSSTAAVAGSWTASWGTHVLLQLHGSPGHLLEATCTVARFTVWDGRLL